MRTIIATLLLIATTGASSAYCVSVPDNQSTGYVKNNVDRTVCLNDELANNTANKNWQVKVDTALGKLDRQVVTNKLDSLKPVIPTVPTYGQPSWP